MQKIVKQSSVNISDNCISIPDVPIHISPAKTLVISDDDEIASEGQNSEDEEYTDFDKEFNSEDTQDEDVIVIGNGEEKEDDTEPKLYKFPTLNEKISEKSTVPTKSTNPQKHKSHSEPHSEVYDTMVEKAVAEASRILDDAHTRAQEELNAAIAKGQDIINEECEKARQIGYAEGLRSQMDNLHDCIEKLETAVADIEGRQEDFFARADQDLKFMAIDIAAKIMGDTIEHDEALLLPLVKSAISAQRSAKWITVEISDKAQTLLQTLRSEIEQSDPDRIRIIGAPVPDGTVKIEMPDGFVDASIYMQIENLREYFKYQI